ncbi:MAG: hypothetical protein R2877_08660 [Bdellovibrionota bacterium]
MSGVEISRTLTTITPQNYEQLSWTYQFTNKETRDQWFAQFFRVGTPKIIFYKTIFKELVVEPIFDIPKIIQKISSVFAKWISNEPCSKHVSKRSHRTQLY